MEHFAAIKALALDLDGTTLLPGAILGERTVRALRAVAARGIRVIFCSGRSPASIEPFRALVGTEGPAVCFNGAVVADLPAGNAAHMAFLPREAGEYCAALSRETGVYVQAYISRSAAPFSCSLLADRDGPEAESYRQHTGSRAVPGDLAAAFRDGQNRDCIKIMFISDDADKLETLRARIRADYGGGLYVTKSSPRYLEVLAGGASKGSGLAFVMRALRLAKEDVIAFGDEENDLPLFEAAGHSAAPANALPPVRARAEYQIASSAEEGVAAFLEAAFRTADETP
jgi:Cof subfamily protein (haloacid dehalogenase superfamily)